MKKRLLSTLLALCLALALLPGTALAATFTPRTTAPNASNEYYYSSKNPFYSSGYEGECTWHAYGRAYEILGSEPKLSLGWAGRWFDDNKANGWYPYGDTPKLGAIAWSPTGHILVVEEIRNDGTPVFSEFNAGWDHKFYYQTRAASYVANLKYIYIFISA